MRTAKPLALAKVHVIDNGWACSVPRVPGHRAAMKRTEACFDVFAAEVHASARSAGAPATRAARIICTIAGAALDRPASVRRK